MPFWRDGRDTSKWIVPLFPSGALYDRSRFTVKAYIPVAPFSGIYAAPVRFRAASTSACSRLLARVLAVSGVHKHRFDRNADSVEVLLGAPFGRSGIDRAVFGLC